MTTLNSAPKRIRIQAPDAPAAFALERRLAHLRPTAVSAGFGWSVELEDADDRLEEIEAAVRHWLREIDLRATVMHVDATTEKMVERAGEESALGAGYDGPRVLTHEP
jgi:hypothetical protein